MSVSSTALLVNSVVATANSLKQGIVGQESVFKVPSKNSKAPTKISFLVAEVIAETEKTFSDGEFGEIF